jgi:phage terminase large subunit-like protein
MPPGAAKSTYTSFLFPAWFLANSPSSPIIAASHTAELSERWGRRVRNLIAEDASTLNLKLRADSQAAGRWQLESGGEYLAAGVSQAILGFRADLIIIDDPTRSREDAMSENIRKATWEWYRSDLRTRLRPGGRIVLITTRWHELDLAGMLLDEMDRGGEIWDTLILPAMAEENDPLGRMPGEFLWDDDNYGYSDLLRRELATQSPSNWASLYQQRPAPESGDYFKAEWLKHEPTPPLDRLSIYAASDFAVSEGKGDYTVHLICGIDGNGDIWILDLWRGRTASDVWVERMLDLAVQWQPINWALEAGPILSAVIPLIDRRAAERRVYFARQHFPSRHDKSVRAQSFRGKAALDGVFISPRAPFYAAFREEWLTFPAGRTDDIIDCCSLIGRMLPVLLAGQRPKKKETGGERWKGYAPAHQEEPHSFKLL